MDSETDIRWTNPTPYLRLIGHCYVDYGYARTGAPCGWQSVGSPEVLESGAVYAFSGRYHKSRPVLYIDGKPDARLTGIYQLMSAELFEQHTTSLQTATP